MFALWPTAGSGCNQRLYMTNGGYLKLILCQPLAATMAVDLLIDWDSATGTVHVHYKYMTMCQIESIFSGGTSGSVSNCALSRQPIHGFNCISYSMNGGHLDSFFIHAIKVL